LFHPPFARGLRLPPIGSNYKTDFWEHSALVQVRSQNDSMNGAVMIKIADYVERLGRLDDEHQIRQEFNAICEKLFRATLDDIAEKDLERFQVGGNLYRYRNIVVCRELGYDLLIQDRVAVPGWEDFAIMIGAKHEGLLPDSAEERMKRRLEAHRAEFLRTRRRRRR
jgi:hypothetical protein